MTPRQAKRLIEKIANASTPSMMKSLIKENLEKFDKTFLNTFSKFIDDVRDKGEENLARYLQMMFKFISALMTNIDIYPNKREGLFATKRLVDSSDDTFDFEEEELYEDEYDLLEEDIGEIEVSPYISDEDRDQLLTLSSEIIVSPQEQEDLELLIAFTEVESEYDISRLVANNMEGL